MKRKPPLGSKHDLLRRPAVARPRLGKNAGCINEHRLPAHLDAHQRNPQIPTLVPHGWFCVEHAPRRRRSARDQGLSFIDHGLFDRPIKSFSRMRGRARQGCAQPDRDRLALRQPRRRGHQRFGWRDAISARLPIKRQFLRVPRSILRHARLPPATGGQSKRNKNDDAMCARTHPDSLQPSL